MKPEDFTLLVVDDIQENRDILSRRLEKQGFSVMSAEGGQEALDLVAKEPIDLVLLDIMMPGINGLEVLQRLRQTYSPTDLPIIMVTAKSESENVVEALDLGANDYVTKPIDFPVVHSRVNATLRTKTAAKHSRGRAADIAPGLVLLEKYKLEDKIGSGSFGAVWRAKHLALDHSVAVKVLQAGQDDATGDAYARFQREGITACRVKHPNAVAVLDFGTTAGGVHFLVMELLEGLSLDQALRAAGTLPPRRCVQILVPVCEALAAAHDTGVIHRDVKPANIFLHRGPRGEVPKVLDFGIAKLAGEQALAQQATVEGWILGTPDYMAPERLRGQVADGKADVYALGVTLFQMLTGRLPFVAETKDPMALAMMHLNDAPPAPRSLNPNIPESLERVVLAAMAKEPDERPDAHELVRRLNQSVESWGTKPVALPAAVAAPAPTGAVRPSQGDVNTVGVAAGAPAAPPPAPARRPPASTPTAASAAARRNAPPPAPKSAETAPMERARPGTGAWMKDLIANAWNRLRR